MVDFYMDSLGFDLWLEQDGCTVLRRENLLLGFCDGDEPDTEGIVTIVLETKSDVEAWYSRLQEMASSEPVENDQFEIYHFFGTDPDGRTVEIQTFLHDLPDEP